MIDTILNRLTTSLLIPSRESEPRICRMPLAGLLSVGLSLIHPGLIDLATHAHAHEPLVSAESELDSSQQWCEFRGNSSVGLALAADPPVHWGERENLVWKTAIHGRGWSSPVVDGGEIWLTTATEDGKKMYVLCVDATDGSIIHDSLLFENEQVQSDYHPTNSYASPTPVLDEEHAFVHFGAYGTACLDRDTGAVLWQRRDLPCNHFRGPGSSPILYKNLLIFHMDGFDYQYAVALDQQTGDTVWKKDRDVEYGTDNGDFFKAYSTPLIIAVDGREMMISPASKACLALDPLTGEELWRVRYEEHSTTVRPVFDGQHLYISTGFGKAKMLCIRVDGSGDVTDSHVVWSQHRGIGSKPSPVLIDERLFGVTDDGIFTRIDPQTGRIEFQKRLGGKFSASLVATPEHIFAFDHDGKGYVFTVADKPQLVAENSLPAGCNASPAIIGDSLIVRTTTHLYRFSSRSDD